MADLTKRIETVANVVVIVVGVIVLIVLVRMYVLPRFNERRQPQVAVGSSISVDNIDWRKNGETLILALSTTCHFCSESAPFYRRLVNETQGKHIVILALLPESPEDAHGFLAKLDIPIRDVRQFPIKTLGVAATPTLILVNEEGKVKSVWLGKLEPDKENEVLSRL